MSWEQIDAVCSTRRFSETTWEMKDHSSIPEQIFLSRENEDWSHEGQTKAYILHTERESRNEHLCRKRERQTEYWTKKTEKWANFSIVSVCLEETFSGHFLMKRIKFPVTAWVCSVSITNCIHQTDTRQSRSVQEPNMQPHMSSSREGDSFQLLLRSILVTQTLTASSHICCTSCALIPLFPSCF